MFDKRINNLVNRVLIVAFLYVLLIYLQKLYAKAIYDNSADSADELAFKKGDILTVIEQDTEGIEGWWLCSLHNRQVSQSDGKGRVYEANKKRKTK